MSIILTNRNMSKAIAKARGGSQAARGAAAPSAVSQVADDSLTRILKMIPGEATALYTAAIAMDENSKELPLVAFLLGALVVVLVIRRSGKLHMPPIAPEPLQYVFQLLAFSAWALAIHSPIGSFVTIPPWIAPLAILCIPIIGGLVLGDDKPPAESPASGGAPG